MQTPVAEAGGVRQGWLTAEQLARSAADGSWDLALVRNPEVAILNDGKDGRRAGCHQRALTCSNREIEPSTYGTDNQHKVSRTSEAWSSRSIDIKLIGL